MYIRTNPLFLTPLLLVAGACFDPRVTLSTDTDAGTDTDPTEDADTSTTDDSATTTPADSDDAADSTGVDDAPPVVLAFTIDGSTMPNERDIGGQILLEADATDDLGLDRVEFYDGEELLAAVAEPPYRMTVMLSSADNGSHVYSARAVDTAEQHGDSEGISLSVNILGGQILELHEDIGSAYMALMWGLPRLALDASGDVLVTRTAAPNLLGNSRVTASRLTPDLSLLWDSALTPFGSSSVALAAPTLTSTGEFLVGTYTAGDPAQTTVYRADFADGTPLEILEMGEAGDFTYPVTTQLSSGSLLLSSHRALVEARSADLSEIEWIREQFTYDPEQGSTWDGIHGFDAGTRGTSLVTFIPSAVTCGATAEACIRLLSPDGTTLWTRPAAGGHSDLPISTARFDAQGRVYSVHGLSDGGLRLLAYDNDGTELGDYTVLEDVAVDISDLAIDHQGNLVIVGYEDFESAWASRITPQGSVLWARAFDELPAGPIFGTAAGGVVVSEGGRAYLTGAGNMEAGDGFSVEGRAWIMEIGL